MASAVVQPSAPESARWPLGTRILFRFWFCYALLYSLPWSGHPTVLDLIPGAEVLFGFYNRMWQAICPWVAIHVFHVTGRAATYFPTGSGDTTLDWVRHLCSLVVAAAACVVWSIGDRKRVQYRKLNAWLRLMVRYTLGLTMLSYGFAKVFPLQFPAPGTDRLIAPFGDFSPMGVLWSFMGSSPAYTIFAGSVEALGGVLLLFRRTASLGAIVSAGAMLNVFVLNMCYDVPVKGYSFILLVMAAYLTLADARRLANVLVLNRPAEPRASDAIAFGSRYLRWSAIGAKALVWVAVLFSVRETWQMYEEYIVRPKPSVLDGIYDVEKVAEHGQDRPPLATDSGRWWKLAINTGSGRIAVRKMDDSLVRYRSKLEGNTLTLSEGGAPFNDNMPGVKFTFAVSQPDPAHLELKGDTIALILRKLDNSVYPLRSRGFHWINELPYNR